MLYGVAGVEKNYNINKILGEDETYIERIVFHPDYLKTGDTVRQSYPKLMIMAKSTTNSKQALSPKF